MIGILGKKVGMTQIFDEEGRQIPVTVVKAGPCYVTELRTKEKNGYTAVQLGFDVAKEKRFSKPLLGQLKKRNLPPLRFIREIRTPVIEGLQVGQKVTVDNFQAGDRVDVIGSSIGRGFQGVVKRHHFKGGEASHGSMFGRVPGSIGQSSFPSRVLKGMKAPGHMGNARVTVQNLKVMHVDRDNHLLTLKGSVPGFENSYLIIRTALKKAQKVAWKVEQPEEQPREAQPVTEAGTKEASESKEAPRSEEEQVPATESVPEQPQEKTPSEETKSKASEEKSS